MPEDTKYYPDSESNEKTGDEDGMDEGGVQSALIPKSLLEGYECKPGEKIVMEVKHLYEDEVEVAFDRKLKGDNEESEPEKNPEDELDSMAISPD